MAGERVVEFLFRVRDEGTKEFKKLAEAAGDFQQTFDDISDDLAKQDKSFAGLRDSAQKLRSAYEGLAKVLSDVRKLRGQTEELDKARKALDEKTASLKEAQAAEAQAAAAAGKANAEYRQQAAGVRTVSQEITELAARQKQLGDTLRIAGQFSKITEEITRYEQRQREAKARVDELTAALKRWQQVQASAAASGRSSPLVDDRVIKVTREIQKLQKELSSSTGTSGIEQRLAKLYERLNALGDAAKKAGVDTRELVKPIAQLEAELAGTQARSAALNPTLQAMAGRLAYLRAESTAAAAALRKASNDTSANANAVKNAERRFAELQARIAPLEAELRAAGVATDRLADEQNRLQKELGETKTSVDRASVALRGQVRAQEQLNNRMKNGMDLQRTSLSLYQRFRGQVLSITAAYIGLYGAVDQVRQAFQAGAQVRGIQNTLSAANGGDARLAAEEMEYTRAQAQRLGVEYTSMAQSYARFRAAVADKMPLEEQRFLFEAVAEAGVVMRLSVDDMQGVFTALTQTFSKGVVSMEELRQQLGDRLPGAVRLLASGLGITEKEMFKLIETGQLTSDNMKFLAKELRKTYGGDLEKALQAPQVQFNRLLNSVTELRVAFEKAAEEAGLGQVLGEITDAISDPKFVEGVKALARAFVELLKVIPAVLRNLEYFVPLLVIIVGSKITLGLGALVQGFAALRNAMKAGAAAGGTLMKLLALHPWVRIAGLVMTVVGAFYSLYKTSGKFQTFIDLVVNGFEKLWENLQFSSAYAIQWAANKAKEIFFGLLKGIGDQVLDMVQRVVKIARGTGLLGDDRAEAAEAGINAMRERMAKAYDRLKAEDADALDTIAAERDRRIAKLDEQRKEILKALEVKRQPGDAPKATADPNPDATPVLPVATDKDAKKLGEELDRLLDSVREKMNAIGAEVARGTSYTFKGVTDGIAADYQKLLEDIQRLVDTKKLTPEQAARYRDTIVARANQRLGVARQEDRGMRADALQGQFDSRASELNQQVALGNLDSVQLEAALTRLRDEFYPQIKAAREEQLRLAQAELDLVILKNGSDETAVAVAQAKVDKIREQNAALGEQRKVLMTVDEANGKIADGLADTSMALLDAVAAGESLSDSFKAAGDVFRQFAADFLREIAQMIIRQMFLNAISNSGLGGGFSRLTGIGLNHDGGVIGQGTSRRSKSVSAGWFANAQRYHTGGVVGLKPNEVPIIAERNEEVLTRNDPRHVLNGGGAQGGAAPRAQDIKIVNAIDSGGVMAAAMDTVEGQRAFINYIRANKSTIKSVLN